MIDKTTVAYYDPNYTSKPNDELIFDAILFAIANPGSYVIITETKDDREFGEYVLIKYGIPLETIVHFGTSDENETNKLPVGAVVVYPTEHIVGNMSSN